MNLNEGPFVIGIIGTVGVPSCYGGFETLVDNLLDSESDFTVYCSGKSYKERLSRYKSARLVYIPLNANGVSSILYDAISMLHAVVMGHKVLLVLGVSGGVFIPFIRVFTRRKLVINIDGLEWRRDKWGWLSKKFLKLSERAAVRFSHIVISDNKGISDYVMEEYGVKSSVIAYGGDHVLTKKSKHYSGDYAFGVCRIEPENNIHVILEAFSRTDTSLKFVGNWDSSVYGVKLKEKYSKFNNIEIVDPIYDLDRLFELRDRCKFYVHGHSAGGTNPSLVEAMFFGKQIVAYDCVYNRATLEGLGLYFKDTESLLTCLSHQRDPSWIDEGDKIVEIAKREYSWKSIRQAYLALL